jgi:hypothetical protein
MFRQFNALADTSPVFFAQRRIYAILDGRFTKLVLTQLMMRKPELQTVANFTE